MPSVSLIGGCCFSSGCPCAQYLRASFCARNICAYWIWLIGSERGAVAILLEAVLDLSNADAQNLGCP